MVKKTCAWMTSEVEPDRKALADRDEQHAELPDADQEAIEATFQAGAWAGQ